MGDICYPRRSQFLDLFRYISGKLVFHDMNHTRWKCHGVSFWGQVQNPFKLTEVNIDYDNIFVMFNTNTQQVAKWLIVLVQS